MTKAILSTRIDEQYIGSIERIAMLRGKNKSEIVEEMLSRGISKCSELTWAERNLFAEQVVHKALDSILAVFQIKMEGQIENKFLTALYTCRYKTDTKFEKNQANAVEISLFEVLNGIKDYDIALYNSILTDMGRIGRIRARYFQIYPKKV